MHYSKVGLGQLTNRPIDMEQLLEGLRNDLVVANDNPDLRLEIICDTPDITGDNTMIFQVFSNLIGNAIYYSSQSTNPKVIVQGEVMDNNRVRYKITDNGVGIKHSKQDQIFSLFSRASNVEGFEGSGVGLSIVKRIIEKHQGQVSVESVPGQGSTFIVDFAYTD